MNRIAKLMLCALLASSPIGIEANYQPDAAPATTQNIQETDWLKIQNWELVKGNSNNTMYSFLSDQYLSDCFQFHRSPNINKYRCFSKDNKYEYTTLFCVILKHGFLCL